MSHKSFARLGVAAAILGASLAASSGANAADSASFKMKRTKGLPAACAPNATADVTVTTQGFAEKMTVKLAGLPARTTFALFAIQVPNFPFGIGWYLGDMTTNYEGKVTKTFVSRLNEETFAVAVGNPAPASQPHGGSDASTNPLFKPVHTFHLGLWFDAAADAVKAKCPGATTPFNGDHTAGVQVLNTGSFADKQGPLRKIN